MDEINVHVSAAAQPLTMSVGEQTQPLSMSILGGGSGGGGGDMFRAVYDKDENGVVDRAEEADFANVARTLDGKSFSDVVDYCGGVNVYTATFDIPKNINPGDDPSNPQPGAPFNPGWMGQSMRFIPSATERPDRAFRVINAWVDDPDAVLGYARFPQPQNNTLTVNASLYASRATKLHAVIVDANGSASSTLFDPGSYEYVFRADKSHLLSEYTNDSGYLKRSDMAPLTINGTTYDGSEPVQMTVGGSGGDMSAYDKNGNGKVDVAEVAEGLTELATHNLYAGIELTDGQVIDALGYMPAGEDAIPTALPCPQPLIINGTTYDGSSPVDMFISGDGSGYLPNGIYNFVHIALSGYISGSSKSVYVLLPMPFLDVNKAYSVSFIGDVSVRGVTGYIYNTTNQTGSNIAENVAKKCNIGITHVNANSLTISVDAETSWYQASATTKAVNNTPVCFTFNGTLTVTVADGTTAQAALLDE